MSQTSLLARVLTLTRPGYIFIPFSHMQITYKHSLISLQKYILKHSVFSRQKHSQISIFFLNLPLSLKLICCYLIVFSLDMVPWPLVTYGAPPGLFSWAVWHSCQMGARNQEQTRGRIGPQLRLGNLRVGELHFCPLCTALDQASSLSRKLAYVPGPTFGFVKLLASSGSHCTKWADEQHRQAGFESRLLPDLPLPFIPTLIGLRAFDLVSSRVWWEAATNKWPLVTYSTCC